MKKFTQALIGLVIIVVMYACTVFVVSITFGPNIFSKLNNLDSAKQKIENPEVVQALQIGMPRNKVYDYMLKESITRITELETEYKLTNSEESAKSLQEEKDNFQSLRARKKTYELTEEEAIKYKNLSDTELIDEINTILKNPVDLQKLRGLSMVLERRHTYMFKYTEGPEALKDHYVSTLKFSVFACIFGIIALLHLLFTYKDDLLEWDTHYEA